MQNGLPTKANRCHKRSSLSSLKLELEVTPFVVGKPFIARSDQWTCDKSHDYELIYLQFKNG